MFIFVVKVKNSSKFRDKVIKSLEIPTYGGCLKRVMFYDVI